MTAMASSSASLTVRHHAAFRPPRGQARLRQEHVIDLDVQCSREGLDVLVHNLIMETLASSCPETPGPQESII